jgi:hypothetical protein
MKVNKYILLPIILLAIIVLNSLNSQDPKQDKCFNVVKELTTLKHLKWASDYSLQIQTQTTKDWLPIVNKVDNNEIVFEFVLSKQLDQDRIKIDFIKNTRQRIQVNLYSFSKRPKLITNNFKFELSPTLTSALNSDTEFEWLTIFELWNDPGWIKSDFPFRLTLNLTKDKKSTFLTPTVKGQFKDYVSGNWQTMWEESIDFEIFAGVEYQLQMVIDMDNNPNLKVTINNLQNGNSIKTESFILLHHPNYNGENGVWGINPIKLYTGSKILNSIFEKKSNLSIKFSDVLVCYK